MISILTPSYNRHYTLKRLYDSLCAQSCMCFEWVIVDDGSIDNTRSMVDGFINDNKIQVRYIYQENTGKPGALNKGVPLCQFDYVFIVDSDDALIDDAVALLITAIDEANKTPVPFSGIGFRRATFDGSTLGVSKAFKDSTRYLNATEAAALFKADLAYCFKKEGLLRHPFPMYNNERFVPELFIWNKITDEAKIRFETNKAIYLSEFLEDGLTKNFKKQLRKHPRGFRVYYADQFQREKSIVKKIKMLIRYFQCMVYEKMK